MALPDSTSQPANETPAPAAGAVAARSGIGIKSIIASTLTIAVVSAIGVGLYRGWTPLERKAVDIIGARAPSVQVRWPALAGTTGKEHGTKGEDSPLGLHLLSVSSASLTDAPTWLPRQMQEEVLALAQAQIDPKASPLSGEPLERVGSALEKSGWFDGRPTVRREPGGRLLVSGQWRIPGAVIRDGGHDYMISWDGKPMPVVYDAGQSKLKAILRVGARPPSAGAAIDYTKAWPGEDVLAGLELLRVIQARPWMDQVVGVDVGNYGKDRTLAITTVNRGRLVWGGRPNKPRLGEASTAAKLAAIDWLQKRLGSIDGNGRSFDVWWQGRPLEIDVSASGGTLPDRPQPALKTSPLPKD